MSVRRADARRRLRAGEDLASVVSATGLALEVVEGLAGALGLVTSAASETTEAEPTFPPCPVCPRCGSDPLGGSYRWTGERWEHACPSLDPQIGHVDVPERLVEAVGFNADCPVELDAPAAARWRGPSLPATEGPRAMGKQVEVGRLLYPETLPPLPSSRGECRRSARPCPHARCKHHLYLSVTRFDSLRFNVPDREAWDLDESCALDVAERGGVTLDAVAELMGITRERVRQLEARALAKVRGTGELNGFTEEASC